MPVSLSSSSLLTFHTPAPSRLPFEVGPSALFEVKLVGGGGRGEQEKRGLSLAFLSHFLSSSSYFLYFSSPLLSLSLGEILHLLLLFHSKTQTSPHTLTNGGRRGKIICCERERGRAGRREQQQKSAQSPRLPPVQI